MKSWNAHQTLQNTVHIVQQASINQALEVRRAQTVMLATSQMPRSQDVMLVLLENMNPMACVSIVQQTVIRLPGLTQFQIVRVLPTFTMSMQLWTKAILDVPPRVHVLSARETVMMIQTVKQDSSAIKDYQHHYLIQFPDAPARDSSATMIIATSTTLQ